MEAIEDASHVPFLPFDLVFLILRSTSFYWCFKDGRFNSWDVLIDGIDNLPTLGNNS